MKSAVKIPVIANGDVRDFDSLDKIFSATGADGVMIGRGAQGNPWIINRLLKYFLTGERLPPPTLDERAAVMRRHLQKIIAFKGERVGVREMRAHAAWYTKGLTGGAELRNLFNRAETADDFLGVIGLIDGRQSTCRADNRTQIEIARVETNSTSKGDTNYG